MKQSWSFTLGVLLVAAAVKPAGAVDIDPLLRHDTFGDIKLSPTGEYYAATVPLEDRTALAILRRPDRTLAGTFNAGKDTHVQEFVWVNEERVLVSIAEKFGTLDEPEPTGELFAVDADGSGAEILVGFRVDEGGLGTRVKPKKAESVGAELVDDLPNDDRSVIIAVWPFTREPHTRAERLDVYTGRRRPVAFAPVARADFMTDHKGVVRFAAGADVDNASELHYRDGDESAWRLINDEGVTGLVELPVGFSEDDRTAYLVAEQGRGPSRLVSFDIASGRRSELFADQVADPAQVLLRHGTLAPIGAWFADGKGRFAFIDEGSEEARLQRSLEAAFKGSVVHVTSRTRDGKLALVLVYSDRNPGDFYLFDVERKKADYVISRRSWVDPGAMASMEPITLKARDGLTLRGYLTRPKGARAPTPLIVFPHGGPFGIQDVWGFHPDVQILAAAGYAVLQINYRGSGGYGDSFEEAGAREWGGKMQDDLTDATRWAIEQGYVDPEKICIYGASYGGYAALMGAAKEPDLYRCAAGYVGVYDLPQMVRDDTKLTRWLGVWASDWVGEPAALGEVSPINLAHRIKVPVFLAAGGEDEVAPIEHSEMMEKALRKAGVPVETLYFPTEGHGFYTEPHRREYYTRLLAFFARHLGGKTASAPEAVSTAK